MLKYFTEGRQMKIMFICTGNICRSAMAHWLLEKMKNSNVGVDDHIDPNKEIDVYSCGIYAYTRR